MLKAIAYGKATRQDYIVQTVNKVGKKEVSEPMTKKQAKDVARKYQEYIICQ